MIPNALCASPGSPGFLSTFSSWDKSISSKGRPTYPALAGFTDEARRCDNKQGGEWSAGAAATDRCAPLATAIVWGKGGQCTGKHGKEEAPWSKHEL
ncbi:hypothetical protein MHYP_G00146740 [Metynnis hypsauchen]